MTVQVQAFPVRFAETVNRFGAARVERTRVDHSLPTLALVTVGDRSFVAKTYGERVSRRGRQTLVSVHGRLTWIASHRVEPLGEATGTGLPAEVEAEVGRLTDSGGAAD